MDYVPMQEGRINFLMENDCTACQQKHYRNRFQTGRGIKSYADMLFKTYIVPTLYSAALLLKTDFISGRKPEKRVSIVRSFIRGIKAHQPEVAPGAA